MPPKAAQKVKAQDKAPATPTKPKIKQNVKPIESEADDEEAETPVKSVKTPTKRTPKKATSQIVEFGMLRRDPESTEIIPVDISMSNEEPQAEPKKKGNGFEKLLKLDSADNFEVLRTFVLTEGPDEGCQVILVRPAKPFKFLQLSKETRQRIYSYYFANKGVLDDAIQLDGKRKGHFLDIYAKTYSNDSKNRVGLLAVNKEINKEAVPIFYAMPIRFDGTTSVMDFLTQIDTSMRQHIVNIEVKTYQKSSARNALSLLAECKKLQRLHFDSGVFAEGDPQKAAKSILLDAHKFFQAVGAARSHKDVGVDIISFGRSALTLKNEVKGKDGKQATKNWPEHMIAELKEILKAKLK